MLKLYSAIPQRQIYKLLWPLPQSQFSCKRLHMVSYFPIPTITRYLKLDASFNYKHCHYVSSWIDIDIKNAVKKEKERSNQKLQKLQIKSLFENSEEVFKNKRDNISSDVAMNEATTLQQHAKKPSGYKEYIDVECQYHKDGSDVKDITKIIRLNSQSIKNDSTDSFKNITHMEYILDNIHGDKPSELWNSLREVLLSGSRALSHKEWDVVAAKLEMCPSLRQFWPTRLMRSFVGQQQREGLAEVCSSLVDYVQEQSGDKGISNMLLASYMAILAEQGQDQNHILNLYSDLTARTNGLLDHELGKCVIRGLSRTDRWKECYAVLDAVKLTSMPTEDHLTPISEAAFRTGATAEGWEMLEHMLDLDQTPLSSVWYTVLHVAATQPALFYDLLLFLQKHQIMLPQAVAEHMAKWTVKNAQETWTWTATKVKTGICQSCHQTLEPSWQVSHEDFTHLREQFMEKSFKRQDVFLSSTPEELQKFQQFLQKSGTFDVVIDGLNVGYTARHPAQAKQLRAVVEHLIKKYPRILVLGKKHMLKWSKVDMAAVTRQVTCFWVEQMSQDDPFILYAALQSGPDTRFVTIDEFRDHSFHLGPKLRNSFRQWQRTRQINAFYTNVTYSKGSANMKWPNVHETRIQMNNGGLHIPYEDGLERRSYELPRTWICLQKTA